MLAVIELINQQTEPFPESAGFNFLFTINKTVESEIPIVITINANGGTANEGMRVGKLQLCDIMTIKNGDRLHACMHAQTGRKF